ncbi:MAG: S9 family peptidase, partial [Brevundimonas sp.]
MRHRSLLSAACAGIALSGALMSAAPALAQVPPAPVPAAPATPDAFTYKDMITANRLGDPQVSPDGRYVVYSVTTTDVEANRRAGSLWMLDLETPDVAPRRLAISDQGANTARWGGDGNLYFLSGKSGASQVWRVASPTATPVQVTNLPLDVNAYRISPSGDKVAVSLAVYPDAADLDASVEMGKAMAERKTTGQVYDRMFVRHWDTWNDHTQNHLFVQSIGRNGQATGTPAWVTKGFDGDTPSKPFGDESDFVFTPAGDSIVFSARLAGKTEPWSTNFDLWKTNGLTGDGTFTNLTQDNPAWDAGPVFSPDGRTLAYRAMARPGFEADRYQIVLMDVQSGQKREIASNWDRSADTLQWSRDGQTLYTTAGDVGSTRLFA